MAFIIESIILCGLFTLAVPLTLMRDPIKGIMSYPPAIRKRVESLSQYRGSIRQEEKGHIGKKLLSIPAFVTIFALICWFSGVRSYPHAFLYSFCLFLVVNLYDLIVLDWLWFCRSPRVRLPGTEDMDKEYRDLWYHLRGFFIGIGIGAGVSVLSAGLIAILQTIIK